MLRLDQRDVPLLLKNCLKLIFLFEMALLRFFYVLFNGARLCLGIVVMVSGGRAGLVWGLHCVLRHVSWPLGVTMTVPKSRRPPASQTRQRSHAAWHAPSPERMGRPTPSGVAGTEAGASPTAEMWRGVTKNTDQWL